MPEDITIFTYDDVKTDTTFTEQTFTKHASGLSHKTYEEFGFQSPHPLINVRNNYILTHMDLKKK